MTVADAKETIRQVIAAGPFDRNWASLKGHSIPSWYEDAKFGIFIHWGVYSVPAFGNEWYPRNMYKAGTDDMRDSPTIPLSRSSNSVPYW